MQRPESSPRHATVGTPTPLRRPYGAPRLNRLGAVADVTAAVSKIGNMDGFMGRRTG